MSHPHCEFNTEGVPLAYFIRFRVLNSLKARATREMRKRGSWKDKKSPWSRHGSKQKLWTEQDIVDAVDYVLNDQGDPLD